MFVRQKEKAACLPQRQLLVLLRGDQEWRRCSLVWELGRQQHVRRQHGDHGCRLLISDAKKACFQHALAIWPCLRLLARHGLTSVSRFVQQWRCTVHSVLSTLEKI